MEPTCAEDEDIRLSSGSSGPNSQASSRRPSLGLRFQYNKDELMELKDRPLSRTRPKCLSPDHNSDEGKWDPEIWIKTFDGSRGESPQMSGVIKDRKRSASDLDREVLFKRKSSDPKARLREEEEDGLGIVLSPQRRSFGTGCHVSNVQSKTTPTPSDSERDSHGPIADQRKGSKIGSGRIQILHDRHDREYREARRPYDRPNPLDRMRRESRDEWDRDTDGRDRLESRDKVESWDRRDKHDNKEKYRRDDRNYERGRHRRQEAEPEWFTGGPSSQSETIELHGFDAPTKENPSNDRPTHVRPVANKAGSSRATEDRLTSHRPTDRNSSPKHTEAKPPRQNKGHGREKKITEHKQPKVSSKSEIDEPFTGSHLQDLSGGMCVTVRNDSLETNESSSPDESSHEDGAPAIVLRRLQQRNHHPEGDSDFDFNEFFKIDNIPGLTDVVHVEEEPSSGSRFRQWFQLKTSSQPGSHNDSRRSSINEEFGYLNELLNAASGQKSPVSSPLFHMPPESYKSAPSQATIVAQHAPHNTPHHPTGGGRPLAVGEVEANLKAILLSGVKSSMSQGGLASKTQQPPAMLPSTGKVTTVSELEAGLKQLGLTKDAQAVAAIKHHTPEALLHKQEPRPEPISQSPPDMEAFNKLLTMMKASGVLADKTPKMPSLQEQQAKMLHHQQQQIKLQQQKQVQEQIFKLMKQNAGLMPKPTPVSPVSPSHSLQPPATSPRCISPVAPQQQTLLQPQPSPSPRAPSPIMFGSQPPLHLTAPSPIHPTQQQSTSQSLSPNTLQVTQANSVRALQRVPSPQELIVHTQAIMQNALIKKQLEDQKERFIKKQQDRSASSTPRAKSPNVCIPLTTVISAGCSQTISVTMATGQPKVSPAFTPTSVIRKMITEKVDRQSEDLSADGVGRAPVLKLVSEEEDAQSRAPPADTPPMMTVSSDGTISIPVPMAPNTGRGREVIHRQPTPVKPRPLVGQGTMNMTCPVSINAGLPVCLASVMAGNNPATLTQNLPHSNAGRAIVKGQNSNASMLSGASAPLQTVPQRSFVGSQPPTAPTAAVRMIGSRGQPGPNSVSPTSSVNPSLLQRLVHPGMVQPAGMKPMAPLSLSAQSQQRSPDSRLQPHHTFYQIRPATSGLTSLPMHSLGAGMSPQLGLHSSLDVASGSGSGLGSVFSSQSGMEGNLAKWFNTDMLKHQGPAMPPLPAQSQKVLTVDEIERRQQMVSN